MTTTKDIKTMLMACIPEDMQEDNLVNNDLIKLGVIDMCSALGVENVSFELIEGEAGEQDDEYSITPDLSLFEQRLAGYFCYILYLEKLKLTLNQDAINFSTLTFSIKGLEKRPEAINDQIYQTRRYLSDYIDRAQGSAAILGKAVQFGSSTDTE